MVWRMEHEEHVALLRDGVGTPGWTWADFGAGWGAFTLALADLLGPGAEIYVVDRDARVLRENERAMRLRFPGVVAHHTVADFTRKLALPPLDGLVMANSLHFQVRQPQVVAMMREYLREGGRMVVVEYNIERGNFAVPHPVNFARWVELATGAGFAHVELLRRRPSRSLHEIYSAVAW